MNLTEEQRKAVELGGDVVACAGSGKTAVVVERYRYMLANKIAEAKAIGIVTFTVRAAQELKTRIEAAGLPVPGYVGTIHGYATRFLPDGFGVAPEKVAEGVKEWACDTFPGEAWPKPAEIGSKDALQAQHVRVVEAYRTRLKSFGLYDYDMILANASEVLWKLVSQRSDPLDITHLIVDEYQDTGAVEQRIYELHENVMRVGDSRQMLYQWRGACGFKADIEANQLTKSFRVPDPIAAQVNKIWPFDPMVGCGPHGSIHWEGYVKWIKDNCLLDGTILCRTNADVGLVLRTLKEEGFPIRMAVEPSDALRKFADHLAITLQPQNDALIDLYLRTWDPPSWQAVKEISETLLIPMWQAVKRINDKSAENGGPLDMLEPGFDKEGTDEVVAFASQYDDHHELLAALYQLKEKVVEGPGFAAMTIHQAKGLEWNNVCFYVPKFFNDTDENRRLTYVALTRAKINLCIDTTRCHSTPAYLKP